MDGLRLEVVVVAYRSRELLRRCLASLRDYAPNGVLTHVVDNASGDGTIEMLRDEFPQVRLHALEGNAGFSHANNVALRETTAPYVLLLNPDTEVLPGALEHMLGVMDSRPDVGMAGCRLVRPDGTFDHAAKRAFPTPVSALGHFTGVGRRSGARGAVADYRAPGLGEHDVGEVDAVNGAFMLVRRAALAQVGFLDEGYWLYMEDLDWCRSFHAAGWKVIYDGRVTVLHVKGGTAGRHRRLRQNVAFHRGMGRFYRKWYAGSQPALDAAVYLGIGAKLGASAVRNAIERRVEERT
jgi:N-acetylglucosaminyl-diphospho-decaprenol L-rhamnosyltransferase